MMIEPLDGYFLSVNGVQGPELFETLGDAQEKAKPHIESKAELQIQLMRTSTAQVLTWNYRYDVNAWIPMLKG